MKQVFIKNGKSRPLWYRNPWVFPGSIQEIKGDPAPGDAVEVRDGKNGAFIGRGFYNPHSFYRVRMLSYDEKQLIDRHLFRKLIRNAFLTRQGLYRTGFHTAFRLINGEGDLLPGFSADFYHQGLILKINALGYYAFLPEITKILLEETRALTGIEPSFILNKISEEEREKEGIEEPSYLIYGQPPETLTIFQDGLQFCFQPLDMQKTGFYLDQRQNRLFLKQWLSGRKNLKILDGFCYTAAFSHYLSDSASEIHAVDSSAAALKAAEASLKTNGISKVILTEEDTSRFLKDHYGYDLIVLDPPKLMKKKEHTEEAAKKYAALNHTAALSLKPGGLLATFSCSGNIDLSGFLTCVQEGLHRAGRGFKLLHQSVNAPDHPMHPSVPETGYLKFIFLQAD